jgi:phosphatidylserine/phosphatidylglycerophosphate/cardiolipin synthase-like enzyme
LARRKRLYLADIAERSIDAQYYIWNSEMSGKLLALKLIEAADSGREILLESAYFVLDESALELAARLREKGVKVRALTNSMASNDVLPNHTS